MFGIIEFRHGIENTPCSCKTPCGYRHYKRGERRYFIDDVEVTAEKALKALTDDALRYVGDNELQVR